MHVDDLIDAYVEDVVRHLPRRQRADVALELRALLQEGLQSRADARGGVMDADVALEGLTAFGRPVDVAARYLDPWIIVPQTETRRFAFAAIVGAAVLVALSPLEPAATRAQQVGLAILMWLGVLVVIFGFRSFRDRRRGESRPWVPRDRDRANRFGSSMLIAVIALGIVAYGAPEWLERPFWPARPMTWWLDYDPEFRASRLPMLLLVWGCQAILFAVLAVRGRWNPALRRTDLGLQIGVVLVLAWFLVAGPVLKQSGANDLARTGIGVVLLLMSVNIGVQRYRGAGGSGAVERAGIQPG